MVRASSNSNAVGSNLLRLSNQTLAAANKVNLYYRLQDSTGPYIQLATSTLPGQDATYITNMAGMHDNYDMLMVAVDQDGKLLRSDQLAVNRSDNTVARNSGVANLPVFTAAGMHLAGLQLSSGKLATSLTYQLDGGETITLTARDSIPGLFEIPVTQAANLRMVLHDTDGGSEQLVGSVDPNNGTSNLQYLKYANSSLTFRNLDQQAVTLAIRYRLEGSESWTSKQLQRQPGQGSNWTWDTQADGLVPDIAQSYRYEVQFDAHDADGVICNNGSAVIAAGAIDGGTYTTASITGAVRPRWVSFNPGLPDAHSLTLSYRVSGTEDEETTVHLERLPSGVFKFDSSALPSDQEYAYRTTALDAGGNPLHRMQGHFRSDSRRQVSDGSNVQWVMALDPDLHSRSQINRSQHYDAFGNIVSETDGNGNTTEFVYNTLGQLTLKRNAATDITLENGYAVNGHRAETRYYYDAGGQLAGWHDANGNLNTQRWHHGSATAKVAQEWHADGGTKRHGYDVFGNLRHTINEDNWRSDYHYDAGNRLTSMTRQINASDSATDHYDYDSKGQRIATTNALGLRSTVDYDVLGRVVRRISAAGRVTTLRYTYDNSIRTIGDAQHGGWRRVMTDANGRSMTDELDVHGRVTRHTDLGGRVFTYRYNLRGLIASQRSTHGQHIDYRYYDNGYLKETRDHGTGTAARYEYDDNGNRTFEGYLAEDGNFAFQQQSVTYDAMNRVINIRDPRYTIAYEYDANGNKRHIRSEYTDGLGNQRAQQNYWYRYDGMHRFTVSMGQLSGGRRATSSNDDSISIERGDNGDGVALTYTQAGLRASASYATHAGQRAHAEHYYYDGRGLLQQTHLSDGSKITRTIDPAGRVTDLKVADTNGALLQHQQRTWDHDHNLLQEHDAPGNKGTSYELMADGTVVASQTYSSDANDTQLRTTFAYHWWDSAKQTSITLQAKNAQVDSWNKVWRPGFSHFSYDVNGNSKLAYDEESKRAFTYWTDNEGQVLKRQELIGGSYDAASGKMNGATKNREHSYYYLDGKRIGDVGNDQTERTDYAQQLATLRSNDNRRSYEKFTPSNAADFDANYQPVNSDYPAAAPGAYTVRAGDTLHSVARALWGDATLWYLLAEANGLIGTQPSVALTANSTLIVPNQVTNIHNTSATFKPYHPGKALGDTMPTLPSAPTPPPPPQSGGGCGGFGQILTIVVIIAATIFTAGAAAVAMGAAASTMGTMAAGMAALTGGLGMGAAALGAAAIGAAVGSIAGQGFAIATGQQSGFSWKQVGLSALGGALSAGAGSVLNGSATMSTFGNVGTASRTITQAAIANTMTQGMMTATGLQHSFDWRGVAASAAAAGVGYAAGRAVNAAMGYQPQANGQGFDWSKQFVSNTASGIAAGTTYAKLHGDDIHAGRLIAGAAVYGAVGASAMEQRLTAAQNEAQQMTMQRAVSAPGMTENGYWNQSHNAANQYADTFGGTAVATSGEASNNPLRVYEYGDKIVATREPVLDTDSSARDITGYADKDGLRMVDVVVSANNDTSPRLPISSTGWQGFIEGMRGDSSTMETESTAKILGRYTGAVGNIANQMFNPKEIAHGLWTAIDSGNPLEMGLAATGFVPAFGGTIRGAPLALERVAARADSVVVRSVSRETDALQRIAANHRAASPWADLRQAYQQAKGQVDFAHIEADVRLWKSGRVDAKGGHFSASSQVQMIPGTGVVAQNGVIRSQVNLLGPDGAFYLKTNNGGFSTLTPTDWSLARAKGEMSQAFFYKKFDGISNQWVGSSSGIDFRFIPPNKNVSLWRGYPKYEK